MYAKIVGTGSYLPKKLLTNADLEKMVDTSNEWIVERSGIQTRHIASEDETSASMGLLAANRALEAANLTATDLDMIIVATTTPDKPLPSTACILQDGLKAYGIPAFDVGAACAGFIYAMSVANAYIKSVMAKNILIVGAEVMSSVIDFTDRRTCVLFGDGAGAVILQASEEPGILSVQLHADGSQKDKLYIPTPFPGRCKVEEPAYVQMRGSEVFRYAVNRLAEIIDETLTANSLEKSAIDWLIPHQANLRIINATAKKLDLPMDRVIVTVDKHGNTSAASIPLAFDEAVRSDRIQRGDMLLFEGIGGGFAWGSALAVY